MEFFDWMSVPQLVLQFVDWQVGTAEEYVRAVWLNLVICLSVAAGLYLIGLVFGGLGLRAIAKREGIAHTYLGFLPFANTWYAGKIAGEASFFGQKMKRAGLYAMLAEIVYFALNVFLYVLQFLALDPLFYKQEFVGDSAYYTWELSTTQMGERAWIGAAMDYCNIISILLLFLTLVFFFVLFTAFFRKYYARSPMAMTFLCVILPVRGFVIFAVRNNRAVDYNDYIRRRMEDYSRRNPPYGTNGPYAGGPYGGYPANSPPPASAPEESPFSDFGESGKGPDGGDDDPFSDF